MMQVDKMSADLRLSKQWLSSWPIIAGYLSLYIPTYVALASGPWGTDRNAHGPLILVCILYAFWEKRHELLECSPRPKLLLGATCFALGLALYLVGRPLDILSFEVSSQIPILAGLILMTTSVSTLKKLWFPLVFIIFIIPIPGALADWLTLPLKEYISVIVDNILYWAGYPVARSGVVLTIGPYQMLIADACSGLNSMYSLSALCLFYIYLRQHASKLQNSILLLSVLPIAFAANIGRVISLLLITYYYGDEAGRSFLHQFAGFAELIFALVVLFLLDMLLSSLFRPMEV